MVTKGPDEMTSGMRSNGRQGRGRPLQGARRGRHCPAIAPAGRREGAAFSDAWRPRLYCKYADGGEVAPAGSGCRPYVSLSYTAATRLRRSSGGYGARHILLA